MIVYIWWIPQHLWQNSPYKKDFLPIFQGKLCACVFLQTIAIFENFATLANHANHGEMIYNEMKDFPFEWNTCHNGYNWKVSRHCTVNLHDNSNKVLVTWPPLTLSTFGEFLTTDKVKMRIKIPHSPKAFVTLGTFEGFHATVNSNMNTQIPWSPKTFVTLSAFEGFLTAVYHHVTLQTAWLTKTPVTLSAFERFLTTVNSNVSI